MGKFYGYFLPIIVTLIIIVFVRRMMVLNLGNLDVDGKPIPKLYCILAFIISLIPIVNWVELVVGIGSLGISISANDLVIKKEKDMSRFEKWLLDVKDE